MDRFEYAQAILGDDESFVAKHKSIKIYHGDQKVSQNSTKMIIISIR